MPFAALIVALLATTVAAPALAAGELTNTIVIREHTPAGSAARDGIPGFVRVTQDGVPIAGAEVSVTIIRKVDVIGNVRSEVHTGTTNADGWFQFSPGLQFRLPGEFFVIARSTSGALTGTSTTTYTVG